MYIATNKTTNKKTGKVYINHKLVEGVRTTAGPRRFDILSLGYLEGLSKDELKALGKILEARIRGRNTLFDAEYPQVADIADQAMKNFDYRKLEKLDEALLESAAVQSEAVAVFIDQTQVSESRSLGPEAAGHQLFVELGLAELFKQGGMTDYQVALAEAVVLARLIEPGSELQCREWIMNRSAVPELTGEGIETVGKNAVYEIADTLLANKARIEEGLRLNEIRLFDKTGTLFLYDLTNTYFEGSANSNELAKRGASKEKRTDCPLVTLALLVDERGFPIFSQIYSGNQSECDTLLDILKRLNADCQDVLPGLKPILIMDRGIATAANLALLKELQYPYVVVQRKDLSKEYIPEFANYQESFELVRDSEDAAVYARKESVRDGARVLVFSEGKQAKEEAMDRLKEERLLAELAKLQGSIAKRSIVKLGKVSERVGRLLERYPSVARHYDIQVIADESGQQAQEVRWQKKESRDVRSIITGCYVIETSLDDLTAQEVFDVYHTLTQVEYAFRCLKTDLGMRPVHHQLARRTEAHLFISVLAYHVLLAIETRLREHKDTRKWSTIRKILSTHQRSTVILQGEDRRTHYMRVSGLPEAQHNDIYKKLGVQNTLKPKHFSIRVVFST